MSQIQDMREQRCKLVADARQIMDNNSQLDAEQRSQVDAMQMKQMYYKKTSIGLKQLNQKNEH